MNKADVTVLVDEIRKLGYKPNSWESSFLRSIVAFNKLTTAQASKLQDIYSKASGGGIYVKKIM